MCICWICSTHINLWFLYSATPIRFFWILQLHFYFLRKYWGRCQNWAFGRLSEPNIWLKEWIAFFLATYPKHFEHKWSLCGRGAWSIVQLMTRCCTPFGLKRIVFNFACQCTWDFTVVAMNTSYVLPMTSSRNSNAIPPRTGPVLWRPGP